MRGGSGGGSGGGGGGADDGGGDGSAGGHLRHEQAVTWLVFAAIGREAYTRASALWAGCGRAHLVEIEPYLLRSFRQLMKSPAVRKKPQITSDGRRSGAKTIA